LEIFWKFREISLLYPYYPKLAFCKKLLSNLSIGNDMLVTDKNQNVPNLVLLTTPSVIQINSTVRKRSGFGYIFEYIQFSNSPSDYHAFPMLTQPAHDVFL